MMLTTSVYWLLSRSTEWGQRRGKRGLREQPECPGDRAGGSKNSPTSDGYQVQFREVPSQLQAFLTLSNCWMTGRDFIITWLEAWGASVTAPRWRR